MRDHKQNRRIQRRKAVNGQLLRAIVLLTVGVTALLPGCSQAEMAETASGEVPIETATETTAAQTAPSFEKTQEEVTPEATATTCASTQGTNPEEILTETETTASPAQETAEGLSEETTSESATEPETTTDPVAEPETTADSATEPEATAAQPATTAPTTAAPTAAPTTAPTTARPTETTQSPETTTEAATQETEPAVLGNAYVEDPLHPGVPYDEAATLALYLELSTVNTNVTDPKSVYRTVSEEYKAVLDGYAWQWLLNGCKNTEEIRAKMEAEYFIWPGGTRKNRFVENSFADYYFTGKDPVILAEGIDRQNFKAFHYVFIKLYYNEAQNQSHVYLINGKIW